MAEVIADGQQNVSLGYTWIKKLNYKTPNEEIRALYDEWADTYDKDTENMGYAGGIVTATHLLELCNKHNLPASIRIMDVGAGTGLMAKLLRKHSLLNIDALDISAKMLDLAKEQGLYKNYFCESLGTGTLPIKSGTYDIVTAAGCFSGGHIRATGLDEIVDITKKGGFMLWTLRKDYYADNKSGYKAKVEELCEKKLWVVEEQKIVDYHINVEESHHQRYCYLFICKRL